MQQNRLYQVGRSPIGEDAEDEQHQSEICEQSVVWNWPIALLAPTPAAPRRFGQGEDTKSKERAKKGRLRERERKRKNEEGKAKRGKEKRRARTGHARGTGDYDSYWPGLAVEQTSLPLRLRLRLSLSVCLLSVCLGQRLQSLRISISYAPFWGLRAQVPGSQGALTVTKMI
ncbi:hypothetical protein TEQG_02681 [Trichophyton equinum CBS 127.97]|uniref:Uncharacterized protein n=1 Tax=Trichophyton equinum (strain ATCC MYA-4606 / CBS 127.97) TaxID=559882 RepID=F2PP32_TRIEC|nr:hypothetical protein TEQG_02681 [Trichophyton equinum CBS 127.97]